VHSQRRTSSTCRSGQVIFCRPCGMYLI